MSETSIPPKARRLRFSLLNVLFLLTIAGLGLVVWRQWQEVRPLRAEVRRWRDENGVLTITDPSKVYIMALPTLERMTWRWRIYVPAGRSYMLHTGQGSATHHQLYSTSGSACSSRLPMENSSQPREIIVAAAIRDGEGGRTLVVDAEGAFKCEIGTPDGITFHTSISRTSTEFEPNLPFEIIRYEGSTRWNGMSDPNVAKPGVAVWLTPN
jgi:hypothetical protein